MAWNLRAIDGTPTVTEAEVALERVALTWDALPTISTSWRLDGTRLTVFVDSPPAIRKVSYTSNAIESLNYSLRKTLRGATDEAILKLFYLGLQRITKQWTAQIPEWKRALKQFALILGDRVPPINSSQSVTPKT